MPAVAKEIVVDGVTFVEKLPKEKRKETHVALILDRSASMGIVREQTVTSVNEQIDQIRKDGAKGGDTYVSLVTFNHEVTPVFWNRPYTELENIGLDQYRTAGNTAMYEGVGVTLETLVKSAKPNKNIDRKFLVIVITDGENNTYGRYSPAQIASQVKELEASGDWTFVYIGCEQDLAEVSKNTGMRTVGYKSSKRGRGYMLDEVLTSNAMYFSGRAGGQSMGSQEYADTLTANISKRESVDQATKDDDGA